MLVLVWCSETLFRAAHVYKVVTCSVYLCYIEGATGPIKLIVHLPLPDKSPAFCSVHRQIIQSLPVVAALSLLSLCLTRETEKSGSPPKVGNEPDYRIVLG